LSILNPIGIFNQRNFEGYHIFLKTEELSLNVLMGIGNRNFKDLGDTRKSQIEWQFLSTTITCTIRWGIIIVVEAEYAIFHTVRLGGKREKECSQTRRLVII